MRSFLRASLFVFLALAISNTASAAVSVPGGDVVVTPDWSGWVCLPPMTGYANVGATLDYYHGLTDTAWKADVRHENFLRNCRRTRGGIFDGEVEVFESTVVFTFLSQDGGAAAPSVSIPAHCEAHSSEQNVEAQYQALQTAMYSLEGHIENQGGWEYLSVTAGHANGLPSPGVTTLTKRADGTVAVTSEFNIRYRIEYRGAPDGPFAGLEGSAEGEVLMRAFPLTSSDPRGNPPGSTPPPPGGSTGPGNGG